MSKQPDEVWFRQRKDGEWEWSFDPPLKRHELRFTRMVRATPATEAAPELLAALERVGCQDKGGCGPGEPDGRCFVCSAIAKAKGETP